MLMLNKLKQSKCCCWDLSFNKYCGLSRMWFVTCWSWQNLSRAAAVLNLHYLYCATSHTLLPSSEWSRPILTVYTQVTLEVPGFILLRINIDNTLARPQSRDTKTEYYFNLLLTLDFAEEIKELQATNKVKQIKVSSRIP